MYLSDWVLRIRGSRRDTLRNSCRRIRGIYQVVWVDIITQSDHPGNPFPRMLDVRGGAQQGSRQCVIPLTTRLLDIQIRLQRAAHSVIPISSSRFILIFTNASQKSDSKRNRLTYGGVVVTTLERYLTDVYFSYCHSTFLWPTVIIASGVIFVLR